MVTVLIDLSTFHPFSERFQIVGNKHAHACAHTGTQDFLSFVSMCFILYLYFLAFFCVVLFEESEIFVNALIDQNKNAAQHHPNSINFSLCFSTSGT